MRGLNGARLNYEIFYMKNRKVIAIEDVPYKAKQLLTENVLRLVKSRTALTDFTVILPTIV